MKYYYANKELELQKMAIYRELNRDKINKQKREYYLKNRDRLNKQVKKYVNTPVGKKLKNETWKRYVINNPIKQKARNIVSNAIKYGTIIPKKCEICGNPISQAHHTDYRKPLKVVWLCHKHHRQSHGQLIGIK